MVKVNVIEEPACRRVLEIEVPTEEITRHRDEIVNEYRKTIVLPGFRRGKAPRDIIQARISDTLRDEILKRAISAAYEKAISSAKMRPATEPQVRDLEFQLDQEEPLRFRVHLEVWPEVALDDYRGLELLREEYEVDEAEVDRALEGFAESRGSVEKVDRPAQLTDVLAVDYWPLDAVGERGDLKQGLIELNAPGTPEPFNSALLNAMAGESRRVVMPASTHTTASGEIHQHPEQVFDVLVKEVREKRLPPVDDAFANSVMEGESDGGVAELRRRLREHLEREEANRSLEMLQEALFDKLLSRTHFDIPEGVVKAELDDIVERARKKRPEVSDEDEAKLRAAYRPSVERSIRIELILAAAGRQENVQVEEADLEAEIRRYAEREGKSAAEIKGRLRRTDGLERLHNDMLRHKVIEKLLELATVEVARKRRS